MKKIAILRRGGLGDVLCLYPLVLYCKEYYPESEITVFVEASNAPIIAYLPSIDRYEVLPRGNKYLSVMHAGWKYRHHFDMAISGKTAPMKLINFFLGALHAKESYAYVQGQWHDCFVTHRRTLRCYESHQSLKHLQLLEPSISSINPRWYPKISFPSHSSSTRTLLVSLSCNRNSALLDVDAYIFLINKLARVFSCSVMVSALPKDEGRVGQVVRLLECPYEVIMTTSFDHYIQALSRADVALTSDGGASHLLAALGRYQVTLFGKTLPSVWAPLSDRAVILYDADNVNHISRFMIYDALELQCSKAFAALAHS